MSTAIFSTGFGSYVHDGQTIETAIDGFKVCASLHLDTDMGPPWKEHDGHGSVSDWTLRDAEEGERVLNRDRNHYRYYDFKGAVEKALAEGWGARNIDAEATPLEIATMAAEEDFEAMKAYCLDQWQWYGVAVTVSKAGIDLTDKFDFAVWGCEGNYPGSDHSHLLEAANDQAGLAIDAAKARAKEIIAALAS